MTSAKFLLEQAFRNAKLAADAAYDVGADEPELHAYLGWERVVHHRTKATFYAAIAAAALKAGKKIKPGYLGGDELLKELVTEAERAALKADAAYRAASDQARTLRALYDSTAHLRPANVQPEKN